MNWGHSDGSVSYSNIPELALVQIQPDPSFFFPSYLCVHFPIKQQKMLLKCYNKLLQNN